MSIDGVVEGSGPGVAASCMEGREGDQSIWPRPARDSNPEPPEYETVTEWQQPCHDLQNVPNDNSNSNNNSNQHREMMYD